MNLLLKAPLYCIGGETSRTVGYDYDYTTLYYVPVFNPNSGRVEKVHTGSTDDRGAWKPVGSQFVPMSETPAEIWAAAEAFKAEEVLNALQQSADCKINSPCLRDIYRGDRLELTRNVRSKNKETGKFDTLKAGEKGEVFWSGTCNFSGQDRVGLRFTDGRKAFIALDACKLDKAMPTDAELAAEARETAAKWRKGGCCV